MKLLSIQEVEPYGFTLYFLAFTLENPPEDNLHSVEIREWVWKRPYTTLELQHIPGVQLEPMDDKGVGVHCVEIEIYSQALQDICTSLNSNGFEFEEIDKDSIKIVDPDGSKIVLRTK